jgi:hypothetical protein
MTETEGFPPGPGPAPAPVFEEAGPPEAPESPEPPGDSGAAAPTAGDIPEGVPDWLRSILEHLLGK